MLEALSTPEQSAINKIEQSKQQKELIKKAIETGKISPPKENEKTGMSLNLAKMGLRCIPSNIKDIEELTDLDISQNPLTDLPAEIAALKNLKSLTINGSDLANLPPDFRELKALEELDISHCKFSNIPDVLFDLPNLKKLNIGNNPRQDSLSEPAPGIRLEYIGNLAQLENLVISQNRYKSLHENLGKLKNLKTLDISNNNLERLPQEIFSLPELKELYAHKNRISEIQPDINYLKKLTLLDLSNNQLKILPKSISHLSNLKRLNISGNLLEVSHLDIKSLMDPDVTQQGIQKIIKNIAAEQVETKIYALKVFFLGETKAGKTSLIKRLKEEDFDRFENTTKGIEIRSKDFKPEELNITLHKTKIRLKIWELGGQSCYFDLHRSLMSKNTVYVLVLDSLDQTQNSKIENWLALIRHYAENSPVIIVRNKVDILDDLKLARNELEVLMAQFREDANLLENEKIADASRKIREIEQEVEENENRLRSNLPQNESQDEIVSTSAKHGIVQKLENAIKRGMAKLVETLNLQDSDRASWLAVQQHFEYMFDLDDQSRIYQAQQKNYTYIQDFEAICKSKGVEDCFIHDAAQFLHESGSIVYFRKQPIIYNPKWLVYGISSVLNDELISGQNGLLPKSRIFLDVGVGNMGGSGFSRSDNTKAFLQEYSLSDKLLILKAMEEFELCLDISFINSKKSGEGYCIIPALISRNEYVLDGEHFQGTLKFEVRYEKPLQFFEQSIIAQLIISRTFRSYIIPNSTYGKKSLIIKHYGDDRNSAYIWLDEKNRSIWIEVDGDSQNCNHLLHQIREEIKTINKDLNLEKYEEWIPIENTEIFIPYKALRDSHRQGFKTFDYHDMKDGLVKIDAEKLWEKYKLSEDSNPTNLLLENSAENLSLPHSPKRSFFYFFDVLGALILDLLKIEKFAETTPRLVGIIFVFLIIGLIAMYIQDANQFQSMINTLTEWFIKVFK